jgi:hypothetical protein
LEAAGPLIWRTAANRLLFRSILFVVSRHAHSAIAEALLCQPLSTNESQHMVCHLNAPADNRLATQISRYTCAVNMGNSHHRANVIFSWDAAEICSNFSHPESVSIVALWEHHSVLMLANGNTAARRARGLPRGIFK